MTVAVFGPLIATHDVEQALLATIEYWIDTYLTGVEAAHGLTLEQIQRPRSYAAAFDRDNWPEGQIPAIVVICPGTLEAPARRGSGEYSAWFEAHADIIVTGTTEADARTVASLYQTAINLLLMQQSGLMGSGSTAFAADLDLVGWAIELPDVDNRTLAVATVEMHVLVDPLIDASAGPLVPSNGSLPPDGPDALTTNLTFVADPVDQPLP